MIKINSELPISLLESHNEKLNDFDFVLFHLYISEPKYKEYFDRMRETKPERKMILDNSAYEFFVKGEELNLDEYEKAIVELNPDYYVLPDTLMNKEKTIMDVLEFREKHQGRIEKLFEQIDEGAPQPIAVVQGNTVDEFNKCLEMLLNLGYNNIAIPFHNGFLKDEIDYCDGDIASVFSQGGYNSCTDDVRYAMGRCMWMKHWGLDIIEPNGKPRYNMIHFLGSHCPVEKRYLASMFAKNSQVSMDTGYPVKCAIEGLELGTETSKPNTIIDDFMHNSFKNEEIDLIEKNVYKFKNY